MQESFERMVLLNPGPVVVTDRVRKALLRGDICHREKEFSRILKRVRQMLLEAFAPSGDYTSAVFTGSGTAAMEAAIASSVEEGRAILIINNGVYGERFSRMASIYKYSKFELVYDWRELPNLGEIEKTLKAHPEIQVIALVHHETSTGLINPVREIGRLAKGFGKVLLLDSISGLGGEELDLEGCNVDLCVGSANKCIQGLPGLSFVVARRKEMERLRKIPPRSMYLHIPTLWESQEKDTIPFTPSIPIFYALEAALEELLEEGVQGRIARYRNVAGVLRQGFREMALRFYLPEALLSNTITTLYLPQGFSYEALHDQLKEKGFVIYAGQERLKGEIFRVANMGALTREDLEGFLNCLGGIVKCGMRSAECGIPHSAFQIPHSKTRAVILAAGVGKRLMPLTGQKPKCLIEISGKTLLERYLESLKEVSVTDVTFVLGHLKEMILPRLKEAENQFKFHYIVNKNYTRGSITSLWEARERLEGDVLIMDADVLFHPALLERLLNSPQKSCFLLEEDFTDTGEEMKLFVQGERVVAISKNAECGIRNAESHTRQSAIHNPQSAIPTLIGEGVGFLKLAGEHCPQLRKILEGFIQQGKLDVEYEEAFDRLLSHCEVGYESVDGLPWIEIDFEEDIKRAERDVLPRIEG
jgi:2-aminoethylphosphonate-pyruvate transaminase